MTGLEIGLLIIGAVFFIGSFFVSEKLSSSDMDEIKGLSEDQVKALIDKSLKEADERVDKAISDKAEEKTEEFTVAADKETNNRIMSIGEYADTVFDSMTKTHDEIVFLYQMLNDKQEQMTKLTKTLGEAESHVRELLTEAEKQSSAAQKASSQVRAVPILKSAPAKKADTSAFPPLQKKTVAPKTPEEKNADKKEAEAIADLKSQEKAPAKPAKATKEKSADSDKKPDPSADTKQTREKILSMYHQGYSLLDIAKETGKGIGEVQLILQLFDEKDGEAGS
ncbi:MAG: hypothetical protein FRC54_05630 [bacterium LCO1.1]|uniref:Uncharacterized protein n=1 Tax=Candidatus Weimeria bifida TaxID=2599074 RepID=A0A6N7J036_9FIRM|nr:hypothetical protein [Candidatus Weimeria bifida]